MWLPDETGEDIRDLVDQQIVDQIGAAEAAGDEETAAQLRRRRLEMALVAWRLPDTRARKNRREAAA